MPLVYFRFALLCSCSFSTFICVTGKVRILKGKGTWGYEKNIKRKTEGILFLQRKTECCSEAIWQTEKFFLAWRLLLLDFFLFFGEYKASDFNRCFVEWTLFFLFREKGKGNPWISSKRRKWKYSLAVVRKGGVGKEGGK